MTVPARMTAPARPATSAPGEAARLATLLEATQLLSGELAPRDALPRVLELLERDHGALRSVVTLLDPEREELYIEASRGLSDEGRLARYRLGEGITGQVVATGRPLVVPEVSREPRFLHRAARRADRAEGEITFVCVPVLVARRAVGALAVDLPYAPDRDYHPLLQFLHLLASLIGQALRVHRETFQLRQELQDRFAFSQLIGTSKAVQEVHRLVMQVAGTDTTVLLRGESGTGKELIASAIHYHSPRAERPFVKVNCAALPDTLLESELFGHERGAFTGALARKQGRFERAHGGTLLLDEVAELTPTAQAKLLRVLQEGEFERVGGTETIRVDVRVIAATNKDLERAMAAGSFREDLYYRLNVFPIFVPPLRERKPDILLLADHFVEKFSRKHGKQVTRISTPAIDMLMSYHWPGNVRELENVIERAVLLSNQQVIHGHHLPPTLQTAQATGTVPSGSLAALVAAYEKDLLQDALKTTRGNRAAAARLLQTTERILGYKVRKYGIDVRRFRS